MQSPWPVPNFPITSSGMAYAPKQKQAVSCGVLTLAGHQVPTTAALSFSSTGKGRQNITKAFWVKIRTGKEHSAIIGMSKTDLTQGN